MRITANQVTFARLAAIPFLAALLYGGTIARMLALFLGIAVGATDFLDGYLARKYGPTVLGGLMDPIADKVFVAVALLPLVHNGWAPWWLAHVVLLRELLVTALRSSFELRRKSLRSTYLAKVKTWVQMLVLALIVAVHVVAAKALVIFFISLTAAALVLGVISIARGRPWRGIWIFFGAWAVAVVGYVALGAEAFLLFWSIAMAAITWISAFDYLALALRDLRNTHWGDVTRIAGAAMLPILSVFCLQRLAVVPWAVMAIVALECAHGGLDNLLAHHDVTAPAWAWAVRTFTTAALLGVALAWPAQAEVLLLGALTVTLAGTAAEFWRKRRYYLDDRPPSKRSVKTASAAVR